jgi:hypothetical protein
MGLAATGNDPDEAWLPESTPLESLATGNAGQVSLIAQKIFSMPW